MLFRSFLVLPIQLSNFQFLSIQGSVTNLLLLPLNLLKRRRFACDFLKKKKEKKKKEGERRRRSPSLESKQSKTLNKSAVLSAAFTP